MFLHVHMHLHVLVAILTSRLNTPTQQDEFITFIANEKRNVEIMREAERQQRRVTGCLDQLTQTLAAFDDEQDLIAKIDEVYHRLDVDNSGGLNFAEFQTGLKYLTIKDRYGNCMGHALVIIFLWDKYM